MNKESFSQKSSRIQRIVEPTVYKTKSKSTQTESQFEGKFINDKEIKRMWFSVFLGPVGFIETFIKSFIKKNDSYIYCDISRAKMERIAIVSIILTIMYSLTIFYYIENIDAKRIDNISKRIKK